MAKSKEFTEEDWEFICNAIKLLFSAIIFILTPKNLAKIFLVLIELILLATFTPAFLVVNFIITSLITNIKLRKITNTYYDFWLDKEEQKEFVEKHNFLCKVVGKLREADQLTEGHRIRNDGKVDERSNAGKRANALNDYYQPMFGNAQKEYDEIAHRPIRRWKRFNALMRHRVACLATMAAGGISLGILCILYSFDQIMIPADTIRQFVIPFIDTNAYFDAFVNLAQVMFLPNVTLVVIYCLFLLIFWNEGKKYSPEPPEVDDDNFCAMWREAEEIEREDIRAKVADIIMQKEGECNIAQTIDKLQKRTEENLKQGHLHKAKIYSGIALVLACEKPSLIILHKRILRLAIFSVYIPAFVTFFIITSIRFKSVYLFFDPVSALTLLGSVGVLWALCRSFARPLSIYFLIPVGVVIGYVSAPRVMSEPSIGSGLYFLIFGIIMSLQFCEFWKRLSLVFWDRMVYSAENLAQITKGLESNFRPVKSHKLLVFFSVLILTFGIGFTTFYFSHDGVPAEKFCKIGIQYIEGQSRTQNIEKGLHFIKLSAEKGYLQAYYILGCYLLSENLGIHKDTTLGVKNIQIAAEGGYPEAQMKLAICLEKGIGIPQNLSDAYLWYAKISETNKKAQQEADRIANIAKYWNAAHKGEVEAQYMLAICYATGNGIDKDETIARKWFMDSANGGYAKAQLALGVWLLKGRGGEQNIPQGMEYCEKAAKQNYSEAFEILGSLYFDGDVVARDYKKAVEHYTKAAQIGSIKAIFNLAFCYREGFGVEKNLAEAFKLFATASEKGFVPAAFCVAECYENGNGVEINYTHALNFYTKAASQKWENATIKKSNADAENGKRRLARIGKYWQAAVENDANAQYQVAVCYLDADGVKKDVKKAFNWFSAAAKQNNIDAIVMIADYQLNGVIVEKNTKAAFETFLKGAELGSATAISRVGWCYEAGLGVEQNYTQAYNWYMKLERKYPGNGIKDAEKIKQVAAVWDDAIKNKKPEAQFLLGSYYAEGVSGLSKDLKKSFSLYQRAADQGHPEAMFRLAQCYVNGIGTKKDLKVALDWYRKAAEKNHGNALFELGGYYLTGNMVEQNLTTAYDCYEKAVQAGFKQATEAKNKIATVAKYWQKAHAGDAESQYMLAKCYAEGVSGVTADETKAFTWYKKAADQGHSEAMFQIVRCYAKGIGVGKDEKIALDWCRKAAEKNHGNALFELGQLYRDGLLVEQNLTTAYQYFEKAEKTGFARATAEKNKISIIAKYWQKAYDGDAESQYQLAQCYVEGTGIAKNTDIAKQWFQKAVDQKHPGAQYDLAVSYIASGKTEQFVPAFELLAQAASNNHTKAIVKLAECYYNGIGVKEDYEKAVELWEKTAKLNDPDAMYFLGVFRSTGRGFFNSGKDFKEALKLWEKSSELRNKDASYKLAIYYKDEKKNFNRSLLYFARASKQGHVQAMYFYGQYQYKQGLQEDGLELIKQAADQGYADAVKFLRNIPARQTTPPSEKTTSKNSYSTPTQENTPPTSVAEKNVNVSGANIAIKQNAKAIEERDAVAAINQLFTKWTPDKFVTASFLPIEGKEGEFISTKKVGNKIKITSYVLLGIDQKKFFRELVPEFTNTLNSIATKQVKISRNSEATWKGGFWWGEYNRQSIQRSPFKLQAKYFLLDEFIKKTKRYRNEIYLNTSYDNFIAYDLPEQVDIDAIRHKLHSKSLTVNIHFLDKDKNIVKTFSTEITKKGEYGAVFNYPMYSYYYYSNVSGIIPLMISPEFCGHRTYEGSHSCAFVYFPQMVKKIEGYVTNEELENIVSANITYEMN